MLHKEPDDGSYVSSTPQNAQRRAATGIELRHSGQSRVVATTSRSVFRRAMSLFTGLITKKNTATATIRNDNKSLVKVPYLIAPFPTWITRKLKSGVPTMPVIGVRM